MPKPTRRPTIADELARELAACSDGIIAVRARSVKAARYYILRRLEQLERRFPRHRFIFAENPHAVSGLHVYPPLRMTNDVGEVIKRWRGRARSNPTAAGLHRVQRDLDDLAWRVRTTYGGTIGRVDPEINRREILASHAG